MRKVWEFHFRLVVCVSCAESKFLIDDGEHPATRGEPWWCPTRHLGPAFLHRRIGRGQTRRDRIGFWNSSGTPSQTGIPLYFFFISISLFRLLHIFPKSQSSIMHIQFRKTQRSFISKTYSRIFLYYFRHGFNRSFSSYIQTKNCRNAYHITFMILIEQSQQNGFSLG